MRLKILFLILILFSCSKKEEIKKIEINPDKAFNVYKEGLTALEKGDYFFASKKFNEAEILFTNVDYSAKSLLLSGYCLYEINFYEESLLNLNRFIRKYPADKNIQYAEYLKIIISYEKILDEKKDLEPLIKTKTNIEKYILKYPNNEYTLDLKFKLGLVDNQLAAKEMYIAKYYIKTKKWIPAINRLKNIVDNYDQTVFVEEALHRLVEIYYEIVLEKEARTAASLLGYNYNSSEWYKNSYEILNKDYKFSKKTKAKKKSDNLIKKILKKIVN